MLAAVHRFRWIPFRTREPPRNRNEKDRLLPSQANEEDPITAGAQGRLLKDAASGCRRREKWL